jgi:hypothetical protein
MQPIEVGQWVNFERRSGSDLYWGTWGMVIDAHTSLKGVRLLIVQTTEDDHSRQFLIEHTMAVLDDGLIHPGTETLTHCWSFRKRPSKRNHDLTFGRLEKDPRIKGCSWSRSF